MAVAAGSEGSPEDVRPTEETEEIASIVDSVLADMRPKIVEEIAKKLGKKPLAVERDYRRIKKDFEI